MEEGQTSGPVDGCALGDPTRESTVCVEGHLVVQGQVTEGRYVFGPLHQDEQLLLHGLADVCDGGDLLRPYIAVQYGRRRRDLHGETQL